MSPRIYMNARAEQSPSANDDRAGIDEYTVEVDKDTFPKLDVEPVINFHGGFNPGLPFEKSSIGNWIIQWWWQRCVVFGDAVDMA